jgi:uncharacterized membrane protein
MKLFTEKIEKRDLLFVGLTLVFIAVLALVPTGFEPVIPENSVRARGVVLDTDNSQVDQLGIVKVGTQLVTVEILSGPFKGKIVEGTNALVGSMELDKMFAPGRKVLVGLDLSLTGERIVHTNIIDHYRIDVELLLFGVFILLLIAFAGWTGVKATLSFVLTALLIWKLLIPGFLRGWNPVVLALGVVAVLTGSIIFLIGGLRRRGLVAFIGAFSGILLTCILSLGFSRGFHLHGAVKPFSETLLYSGFPHLDLTSIFLAGIFLASSGAVMDVAMDISASMNEVHCNHPQISRWALIKSGFAVGRAVIGTMTTTLLLAYTGGFTAMLMVFMAQGTPVTNVLNIQYVSSEILHTLVGSFGLVAVAPFTALLGGLLYARTDRVTDREPLLPDHSSGILHQPCSDTELRSKAPLEPSRTP